MCKDLRVISIFMIAKIEIPKDNKKNYLDKWSWSPNYTYLSILSDITSSQKEHREN